jgi:uncharacterized damage-inducible protein DinB
MSALRQIRMLTRYSAWAHGRLFDALAQLPEEALARDGGGAGSILKTMNHMHVVDRIWQANLEGREHGYTARNTPTLPAFADLAAEQRRIDTWYVEYAAGLSGARLGEVVPFTFVGGGEAAMARIDMLLHIVNHKTYHRGYVAEMLYRDKVKPPTMDLTVFLRDVEPAAVTAPAE